MDGLGFYMQHIAGAELGIYVLSHVLEAFVITTELGRAHLLMIKRLLF
jgi:hypothetical protein